MVYYIDSKYGNDLNDGLSRQTAFASVGRMSEITLKGGDSVLIKAGTEYSGSLNLKRVRDGGLIKIDRYGVGEKPIINGTGESPILLTNFDNVEIQNITVTNKSGAMGIQILAEEPGEYPNVSVCRCEVYQVNEGREPYVHECGGIMLCAWGEEPTWFKDVLIEDNKLEDVCRSGIMLSSPWIVRPDGLWGKNRYVDDNNGWFPTENLIVRGNYLNRIGGDGIIIEGIKGGLLEWNKVFNIMTNPIPPCSNAGIWPINSNDCIVQYNEVGFSHKPDDCNDAQGFDVDASCRNTLVQYNYSHDNEGGFILLCEVAGIRNEEFKGTVVRNNLSVNDGKVKGELIALVGSVRGALIENNTFIVPSEVHHIVEVFSLDGLNQAKNLDINGNRFISAVKTDEPSRNNLYNGEDIRFDGNLYSGRGHIAAKDEKNIKTDTALADIEKEIDLFEQLIRSKKEIKLNFDGERYL